MVNNRGRFFANSGQRKKQLYHAQYDDTGCVVLVDDGFDDLYMGIQSHAPSVDVHVLLKRFASGDPSALSKRQGIYTDVVGMPKTYAELLNTVNDLERKFMELPPDVREKFGNSFAQYAAKIGTPDYLTALGISDDSPAAEAAAVKLNEEVTNE